MPILTNILQKAGKSPKQSKKPRARSESKNRPPAPVAQEKNQKSNLKQKSAPATQASPSTQKVATQNAHNAYQIIVRPHISEKSVQCKDQGKYIFEVFQHATARSVAQAVKKLYNTEVVKVRIVKVPHKSTRMRMRNIKGTSTRYNKAIVTIKKGQTIEVLPQ